MFFNGPAGRSGREATTAADEALASRGMPRFSRYISAPDAELIRAYVARQAAFLFAQEQERATQ